MSLYNGPPRPGARGGRDQFNWESVKSDKDREFYLGHSVKATTGRWQKGKDVFWYTREKNETGSDPRVDELALVKQREEELMMEALGMKPKTIRPSTKPQLSKQEMKQLLEGNAADQEQEADGDEREIDKVKGVGFRSGQIVGSGDAEHEVMGGVGLGRLQPGNAAPDASRGPQHPDGSRLPMPPQVSAHDLKRIRKVQGKEARKAEKKAEKKERKEARKAKKERKKHKHKISEDDRASASSSDSERENKRHKQDISPPRKRQKEVKRTAALSDESDPGSPARGHHGRDSDVYGKRRESASRRSVTPPRRRSSRPDRRSRSGSPPRQGHRRRERTPERSSRRR